MYSKLALLALLAGAEAFETSTLRPSSPMARLSGLRMETPAEAQTKEAAADQAVSEAPPPASIEYSEALPFLTRRASLGPKSALVGDVGFDPLGFTEIFPLVRGATNRTSDPPQSTHARWRQEARAYTE